MFSIHFLKLVACIVRIPLLPKSQPAPPPSPRRGPSPSATNDLFTRLPVPDNSARKPPRQDPRPAPACSPGGLADHRGVAPPRRWPGGLSGSPAPALRRGGRRAGRPGAWDRPCRRGASIPGWFEDSLRLVCRGVGRAGRVGGGAGAGAAGLLPAGAWPGLRGALAGPEYRVAELETDRCAIFTSMRVSPCAALRPGVASWNRWRRAAVDLSLEMIGG